MGTAFPILTPFPRLCQPSNDLLDHGLQLLGHEQVPVNGLLETELHHRK